MRRVLFLLFKCEHRLGYVRFVSSPATFLQVMDPIVIGADDAFIDFIVRQPSVHIVFANDIRHRCIGIDRAYGEELAVLVFAQHMGFIIDKTETVIVRWDIRNRAFCGFNKLTQQMEDPRHAFELCVGCRLVGK